MSSTVRPSIAVIGFSNVAYRTACRLAAGGERVQLVLTRGEIAQLTPLPAGIESVPVPHLHPGSLPVLENCRAAVVATEDEQLNLHLLMHLNVSYPGLRIVTRFFNLALGREIEARLPNVSVLSVSDLAAPVFVARAFADTVLSAWREHDFLRHRFGYGQSRGRPQRPGPQPQDSHRGQSL